MADGYEEIREIIGDDRIRRSWADSLDEVCVLENDNDTITQRQKIATRYVKRDNEDGEQAIIFWTVMEICKNSDDETVLVKYKEFTTNKPDWIPYSDSELDS
jgi:hypothetical protein